jgi:hypothetical protein
LAGLKKKKPKRKRRESPHSKSPAGGSLVFVEATAVSRDGRTTSGDLGIWEDRHAEPLARIALSPGAGRQA